MDIKQLLESALDPIHKHLNTEIFNSNGKILESVSDFILETFIEWWSKLGYDQDVIKSMIVIGSITGYQYSNNSDIDVNVNVDLDDDEIKELSKLLPNGNILPETEHPVNYYITNTLENVKKAESAYDIIDDAWLKQPKKDEVEIPYSYSFEIAKFFMDGLDQRINEYERDKHELEIYKGYLEDEELETNKDDIDKVIELKENEIKADLDAIHVGYKMLKAFRNKAFEKDYEPDFLITIETKHPNKSINNLVYKIVERFGYLDKVVKYNELRKAYEK